MIPGLSDNAIVRVSLQRPIAMAMVLLSMLVLGVVALVRIPLELIPSGFSAPFLSVSVNYPDATARDIEEKITRPLEESLATTPGLDQISGTSTSGSSQVVMVFAPDTDMDIAYRQVRDRVARVRADLPAEVDEIRLRKESGESIPVAFYGIIWDPELADPLRVIEERLKRPIERIDGVGLVNLWGDQEDEVRIEVDRALADAAGVDMVQLVTTLGRANFTLASGAVQDEGRMLLVRSVASFTTPEEIGEIVVTPKGLRVRDVATVTYGAPERTRYDRYNGRPSMVMAIVKESQANTVDVCERIKAAVEEAAGHPDLQGVSVQKVFVQGDTIKYSLDQVVSSGLQGGVIALVVLLFFLRRLRLTIVIALSIPLSLFLAVPVMYFTGQTINLVSLVGLMICVGMVVDNSIVVAENIVRFRRRGLGPYAAALQGAGEIALASTLATATTVIVFLPASLLSEGPTQFFMVRMVTPVCVSLAASLFVALVLVPMTSTRILDEAVPEGWPRLRLVEKACKRALEVAYDSTMGACNRIYAQLLRITLRRRMDVVLGVLIALGSTALPFMNVKCASGSNFGTRRVQVNYSMPSDTTLEDANAFFRDLEGFIEDVAPTYRVTGQYLGFDANSGNVQIFFEPPSPDEPPFEQLSRDLVEQLPTRPGWRKTSQFGESDGAKDDTFRVAVYGDDHDEVADARDRLQAALLEIPGVLGERGTGEDTRRRDELALSVERTMSERFGVPAGAVANTVAYAIRGTPLPRFHTDEREVDVRIRYRPEDREDVDQILGWQVMGRDGRGVPLQVLADKHVTRGEAQLRRHNKRVGAVVMLDLDREDRPATVRRIADFLKGYPLPEGLSFDADADQRQVDDMARDLFGALALGSIFVFLVMGFLFESFVLPMAVMPSIPLSFVGVWWTLFVTRENIDPLAGIGIVLLIGVVVNNAIVLVDFVNSARAAGMAREDAIVQAGRLRFRPIMMTSLTTIGGLLPLAFTEPTGEGIPYQAFGKALVGGMATATVLTLLVVPIAYAYLDDLREAMRVWWARLFRRR